MYIESNRHQNRKEHKYKKIGMHINTGISFYRILIIYLLLISIRKVLKHFRLQQTVMQGQ